MDSAANIAIVGLSLTSLYLYVRQNKTSEGDKTKETQSVECKSKLAALQRIYLPAHLLALFSDWLQGPYVFQLYKHHGHGDKEIAVLFLAGYLSSCIFGSFTGPSADKYGRKLLGQIFCVICGLSCLTKISPNFYILFAGRVLSGVSTSCLYSVFECWFVSEHKFRDLPSESIPSTLAMVTSANSLIAITAGLFSDFLVQGLALGPLAPFIVAIPCLAVGLVIISCTWTENYGTNTSVMETYKEGARIIWSDVSIMKVGIVQSLVESSMFIFVYLWTPTLSSGQEKIPLGKIFASFMLSIMIGSLLFRTLIKLVTAQKILFFATITFLMSTLIASQLASSNTNTSRYVCLVVFLFIEISLGMYFPSIGTLRSGLVPGSHRSTIVNLFRIPLNLLTVATLLAIKSGVVEDRGLVFGITSIFLTGAVLVSYSIGLEKKKQN